MAIKLNASSIQSFLFIIIFTLIVYFFIYKQVYGPYVPYVYLIFKKIYKIIKINDWNIFIIIFYFVKIKLTFLFKCPLKRRDRGSLKVLLVAACISLDRIFINI